MKHKIIPAWPCKCGYRNDVEVRPCSDFNWNVNRNNEFWVGIGTLMRTCKACKNEAGFAFPDHNLYDSEDEARRDFGLAPIAATPPEVQA